MNSTHRYAELLHDDDQGIARGAELLRGGCLVAFPTETVYGLGADARDDRAVARIYAAKNRPAFNPLIVHLATPGAAATYAHLDDNAERLAAAFWPGPLTLVLPLRRNAGLSELVTAGNASVALRVPAHPLAVRLLAAAGIPVAAPSANPSGRVSPTEAAHVTAWLGDRVDAVIDGGACAVGVESTIVSLDGTPALLRPGGLPVEAIEDCLGARLPRPADPALPQAPGQLASHYAPRARLRTNAVQPDAGEVFIGFGHTMFPAALNLSVNGDLVEAAANLFRHLRQADDLAGPDGRIAVAPVPLHGLGLAINDRLRRASAPRG